MCSGFNVLLPSPPGSPRPPAEWQPAVQILLYSLIFLLSVLGNTLVITVLIRNKRMRTVTNIFLLSLAVSDLMLCLFCMPFNLIPNLLKDFIFGSAVCKTTTYFMGEWLLGALAGLDLPKPLAASARPEPKQNRTPKKHLAVWGWVRGRRC